MELNDEIYVGDLNVDEPEIDIGDIEGANEIPTNNHNDLYNRDADNQHPISAITGLQEALDSKVDEVEGKGLSENDFTDEYKDKLDGIEDGAEVNTITSVNGKTGDVVLATDDISDTNQDNKFVSTQEKNTWNNKVDKDVNNLTNYTKTSDLGTLAMKDSVDYNTDVNNKPAINNGTLTIQKNGTTLGIFGANSSQDVTVNIEADQQVQSDWNQGNSSKPDYIKNKPTIPVVNNGTLTIQKNGVTVATFTANSSNNVTANIEADAQVQANWNQNNSSQPDYIKNKPDLSGFITNTVDNLVNYYLKSETYTRTEVNNLIASISGGLNLEIVAQLPTASSETYFSNSHTIYMVANSSQSGNNYYDEYITIRNGTEGSYTYSWEVIGSTQIDLTNYVQKTTKIAGIDLQDDITTNELKDALGIKFIVTLGRYIENGDTKTSSGSIAQTGTTTTEDSGWVQPQAEGRGSAAFGRGTVAGGQQDWSNPDSANHDYAFATGKNSKAYGDSSFVANRGNTVTGANAAGFGESTQAKGKDSFTAGYGSIAYDKGAIATGYYTEAKGEYSFTANSGDTNGKYAFAANEETRANAEAASSFGRSTQANGANSMATGHNTVAGHTSSFAGGRNTKTSKENQMVVGQYNEDDSNALFIVGDGTADNARSNCFEAGADGSGNFIKVGNTRFNESEIAKRSNIPSSINGLGGGTLTSPLNVTGGDSSSSAKIAMSNSGSGQITDEGTHTLFGFTQDYADTLTIGHNSYKTNLRGSGTRPTYKGDDLALYSDLPSVPVKSISAGGQALTPDANGNVNIPVGAVNTYGVYKLGQYTNLKLINRFSDYGVLGIDQVTANDIANRLPYKAPTLMNLNNCVKAALTDTNHLTMTTAEQETAKSVLGVTDEIFTATYGTTTYSEIGDALTANKEIICIKDNSIYRYVSRIGGSYRFNFMRDNGQYYFVQVNSSDVWSYGTADYVTANNYKTYVTNALAGSSPISLTTSEQETAQSVLGIQFGIPRLSANES